MKPDKMPKKQCSCCGLKKPLGEFGIRKSAKDGMSQWCKKCYNKKNRDSRLRCIEKPGWYEEKRKKALKYWLKRNYGLTPADYEAIATSQNDVCAICEKPETVTIHDRIPRLTVDHNHETDRVRGLLCRKCNSAIGLFGEDTHVLAGAIKYLTKIE